MSAEAFLNLPRGFASQLLAGANPRCFWTPNARYANAAFERVFAANFTPPRNVDYADIGGYRCTFTPLQVGDETGVFIDAVPFAESECDSRLLQLPEIVRLATKTDSSITDIRRFIEYLIDLRPALFSGAKLFVSRRGHRFVLVRETGTPDGTSRTWARWPLHRLFVNRRACVIRSPAGNLQALAVPFDVAPAQRYVVIATLRCSPELTAAERVFMGCLEGLLLPLKPPQEPVRVFALDSIRTEPLASAPTFLWYGSSGALRDRMQEILLQRGWDLRCVSTLAEVLQAVERGAVDIVMLDGSIAGDPARILRALRLVAGQLDVPLLFFDRRQPTPEIEALIEQYLPPDAGKDRILRAIKEVIRLVPERRAEALRGAAAGFSGALQNVADCTELARLLAVGATELAGDFASVTLIDNAGNMYAAESPSRQEPLLDRIPLTLLSGYAVMRSRIDSEFFREVTDDPAAQQRLESFGALSGATIPIADGGRIVGSLVVLSSTRRMYEPECEALLQLADIGARAFSEVQTRMLRSQAVANDTYEPLWEQLSSGECELNAYRGPRARTWIRIAALDASRVGITAVSGRDVEASFETAEAALQELATVVHHWDDVADAVDATVAAFDDGSRGIFAGIVSIDSSRLTFSAARFPAPVQIASKGPAPALSVSERRHRGTISIRPRSVTLIYDVDMHDSVDSAKVVQAVQGKLRIGAGNAVQPLPKLANDPYRVAFCSIMKRMFGAERPGSPEPA